MRLRILLIFLVVVSAIHAEEPLRLAQFDCDVTPNVGQALTYDPMRDASELSLRCRGIVLLGAEQPIVLCAVDWIGIANESYDVFRQAIAEAAGTVPERVALHTLHQHDAPICDFTTERLLRENALDPGPFDSAITRPLIDRTAEAVRSAISEVQPITHVGWGKAQVEEVASNRRLFHPDGTFRATRYTSCADPILRAAPVGTIDPEVNVVSFWNEEKAVVVLSYYATHPQSYYRTGVANSDFPGLARFLRGQSVPDTLHVHFNGAGGDIGAGKYNDGSPGNRTLLALRLADGMRRAFEATEKQPIVSDDISWKIERVQLPLSPNLVRETLEQALQPSGGAVNSILGSAMQLAWLMRTEEERPVELSCLSLGDIRLVHMPGELFVEYQLAAKAMAPELKVTMAAYGQYGPAYIGTARSYSEGGYEVGPSASFVAPEVEEVLLGGTRRLLSSE